MIRRVRKWAMSMYRLASVHVEFWSLVFIQRRRESEWWTGWIRSLRGYFLSPVGSLSTRMILQSERKILSYQRTIGDQRVLFDDKPTLFRVISESLSSTAENNIIFPESQTSIETGRLLTEMHDQTESTTNPMVEFDVLSQTLSLSDRLSSNDNEIFVIPAGYKPAKTTRFPRIHCALSSINTSGSFSLLAHSLLNESRLSRAMTVSNGAEDGGWSMAVRFHFPGDSDNWSSAEGATPISDVIERLARSLPLFRRIQWTLWEIDANRYVLLDADTRIDAARFSGNLKSETIDLRRI